MLIIVHPVAAHVGEQLLHNVVPAKGERPKSANAVGWIRSQKESTNSDEWTKPRIPAKIRLGF